MTWFIIYIYLLFHKYITSCIYMLVNLVFMGNRLCGQDFSVLNSYFKCQHIYLLVVLHICTTNISYIVIFSWRVPLNYIKYTGICPLYTFEEHAFINCYQERLLHIFMETEDGHIQKGRYREKIEAIFHGWQIQKMDNAIHLILLASHPFPWNQIAWNVNIDA